MAHPHRVLAIGALLAVLGWAADTRTSVQSDLTKLVPQDSAALADIRALEGETGISGEVDVLVRGDDLTAVPAVRDWLAEGLDGRREATDAWRLPQGWAASSARGEVVLVALAPTRAEAKRMTRVR